MLEVHIFMFLILFLIFLNQLFFGAIARNIVPGFILTEDMTRAFKFTMQSFISKFLERLVARRLLIHSELNELLPRYQSAYRPHHSTETAFVNSRYKRHPVLR